MTNKLITFCMLFLISIACISSGCVTTIDTFSNHNPEDKIYADYMDSGYYYFEDDNGKSFYQTLYEGDSSIYSTGKTPNEWINFIQNMDYESDGLNNAEYFYNVTETMEKQAGDCEDLSILMARGLYDMGFDTCIVITETHVATGINKHQVDNQYKNIERLIYIEELPWKDNIYFTTENGTEYYILESTCQANIGAYDEELIIEKIYVLNN